MAALLTACLRFTERVDRCVSSKEVILALDEAVRPTLNLFGVWSIPLAAQRGDRNPYRIYVHPSMGDHMERIWPRIRENGPSFLARYCMRTRRDFSLRDAIRDEKPTPAELWIVEELRKSGVGDVKCVAVMDWWIGVFWSPRKNIRLDKHEWRALRIASRAAADRIEELDGREKRLPPLTGQERATLRLLKDDHSQREVARQLKVSVGTVKQNVARSAKKLGTKGLRNTIAEAVRHYVVLAIAAAIACAGACALGPGGACDGIADDDTTLPPPWFSTEQLLPFYDELEGYLAGEDDGAQRLTGLW